MIFFYTYDHLVFVNLQASVYPLTFFIVFFSLGYIRLDKKIIEATFLRKYEFKISRILGSLSLSAWGEGGGGCGP